MTTDPSRGPSPEVVVSVEALAVLVAKLSTSAVLAVDVESNGLFVHRPRLCTVQLAWVEPPEVRVAVVDTLTARAEGLRALLGEAGPVKILHDLTFDARLLEENGVTLGNVRDTSVAARFLGRKNLGLSSLLLAERGVVVDKSLQQHDWSRRPLTETQLTYLGNDVRHLFGLDAHLREEVLGKGLEEFVADETAYKLSEALRPPTPNRTPHLGVKGATDLPRARWPLLRRLYGVREAIAREDDLPPFKVLPPDVLIVLAREAPEDPSRLTRLLGTRHPAARHVARFADALKEGTRDVVLDADERAILDRAAPAPDVRKAYQRREERLRAFRRREALATSLDEQAILPGHCAKALATAAPTTTEGLRGVAGLGEARILRWGPRLLELLSLAPDGDQSVRPPETELSTRRKSLSPRSCNEGQNHLRNAPTSRGRGQCPGRPRLPDGTRGPW